MEQTSLSNHPTAAPLSLAIAYIVPQPEKNEIYPHDQALKRGTIFPCLDMPFTRGADIHER